MRRQHHATVTSFASCSHSCAGCHFGLNSPEALLSGGCFRPWPAPSACARCRRRRPEARCVGARPRCHGASPTLVRRVRLPKHVHHRLCVFVCVGGDVGDILNLWISTHPPGAREPFAHKPQSLHFGRLLGAIWRACCWIGRRLGQVSCDTIARPRCRAGDLNPCSLGLGIAHHGCAYKVVVLLGAHA